MNILIISADKAEQYLIQYYISELKTTDRIIEIALSLAEAKSIVQQTTVDLIIIHLNISDLDINETFNVVRQLSTVFICIAPTSEWAHLAFSNNAADYIVEPVDFSSFFRAMNKVQKMLFNDFVKKQVELSLNELALSKKIAISSHDGYELLCLADIIYCQSDSNYTTLYLSNDSSYVVSRTLKEFEETFPPKHFFRIHKSYLVNIRHIARYIKSNGGCIQTSSGITLPVSRNKKELLLQLIENL